MAFFGTLLKDNATFFSDFAEPIIYTPKGGTPINIKAIITRSVATRLNESERVIGDEVTIEVSVGDVPAVNRDGDTATLPVKLGTTPTTLTVRTILAQDQGTWKLKVA